MISSREALDVSSDTWPCTAPVKILPAAANNQSRLRRAGPELLICVIVFLGFKAGWATIYKPSGRDIDAKGLAFETGIHGLAPEFAPPARLLVAAEWHGWIEHERLQLSERFGV